MGILLLDFYSQSCGLLLTNTLALVFLLTLYYASATSTALMSSIIMGLSIGFIAPSGMGYISECCEPQFRGYLSFSVPFLQNIVLLFFTVIGSLVDWRTFALINAIIPLVSVILLPWVMMAEKYDKTILYRIGNVPM